MTDNEDSTGDGLFSRDMASPSRQVRWLKGGVIGVIALVLIGTWVWVLGSESGSIRAMSPAQREALYQEAWADQRAKCLGGDGPRDTESRCRQRAEFLLRFPQC
ncbi:hypothetical protein, partial [Hyalangium sp.]|uniref:hypothetical protein n=1 Tax=Hyalangium sp. TaxID=2028555 RepID=UPI002D6D99B6